MVIFTLLFNRFAGIRSTAPRSYPLFCLSGVVVWTLFAKGSAHASDSLVANANVITKVYFPRVVVPVGRECVAADGRLRRRLRAAGRR